MSRRFRAEELEEAADALEGEHPQRIVDWALSSFPPTRMVILTALQLDGVAVTDMALARQPATRVVTIDTGRLPGETYTYLDILRAVRGWSIEVVLPRGSAIGRFVSEHGVNSFYGSLERRLDCCHLRKVEPLQRVLAGADCWLTGLRRDQAPSRASVRAIEFDWEHGGIVKVNPLAGWTEEQSRAYLEERGIPLHPLYGKGYRSIGCAPCTRPVAPGEDARAGRWWWERDQGVATECGIHLAGGARGAAAASVAPDGERRDAAVAGTPQS